MSMRWMAAGILSAATAIALAKLPAPTPEQEQAAAAKKQQEQAQLEKEKAQLERAQDRVANQYKRSRGIATGGTANAGRVEDTNMPKTTKELPHDTAPQGGRKQSAEAHSTPAK
jgi:hypothetical protein